MNYFWQYIFQHTNDFIYTLAKILILSLGFIKYSLTFYSFADFRSTELKFASVSSSKLNISIVLFSSSLIKLAKRVNCLSYTSADLDWTEPKTWLSWMKLYSSDNYYTTVSPIKHPPLKGVVDLIFKVQNKLFTDSIIIWIFSKKQMETEGLKLAVSLIMHQFFHPLTNNHCLGDFFNKLYI